VKTLFSFASNDDELLETAIQFFVDTPTITKAKATAPMTAAPKIISFVTLLAFSITSPGANATSVYLTSRYSSIERS
jgi:hypothetical protein